MFFGTLCIYDLYDGCVTVFNAWLMFLTQTHSLQDLRQQATVASKVFVQRDYTSGTICKFQTKFPTELETRVRHHPHSRHY